ncbi:MAG: winged helix-turn-helix transcriptional regulator [Euryarchaeota archaeon]|nr:winged helix-turn-helix transcriptional regulator [Euryarchaeota archaeon]
MDRDPLDEMHAELCKVFTSPARIRILGHLRDGERSVGDLAEVIGLPQPNVSQHLTVMRSRGMVTTRKAGATVYYRLANPKILKAFDIIREVLDENLSEVGRLGKRGR